MLHADISRPAQDPLTSPDDVPPTVPVAGEPESDWLEILAIAAALRADRGKDHVTLRVGGPASASARGATVADFAERFCARRGR